MAVQTRSAFARTHVARPRLSRSTTVRAVAKVQAPSGVSVPSQVPQVPPARFGFVDWAEKINSRAAMIGFIAILVVEGIAGRGLLEMSGIVVGKGLGFEL